MRILGSRTAHELFLRKVRREACGQCASIIRSNQNWCLAIGADFSLCTDSIWRLIGKKNIVVTSEDDGHQFGLPAPVDAAEKLNRLLTDKPLEQIELNAVTGDFSFYFSGPLVLEILTSSAGYESWQLYRRGELEAVGKNGGVV